MKVGLIVAIAENGIIGSNNALPWRLSGDLQYFKKTTLGKPIILGRKTYESIGKPLPGRTNIVITRNKSFQAQGCIVVSSLVDAVNCAMREGDELMIIGGAQLYQEALQAQPPLVTHLYITQVHHPVEGDTYFPNINYAQWREVSRERQCADDKNEYDYSIVVYQRSEQARQNNGE